MSPGGTDRGVSFPLTHAVTLTIATVVVTGLLASVAGYVADERVHTTERELSAIGADLVADLAAVDRAAEGGNDATILLSVALPRQVTGGAYTVSLESVGACTSGGTSVACLELHAPDAGVRTALPFRNETPVIEGTATGGRLAIVAENGTLSIEDRP